MAGIRHGDLRERPGRSAREAEPKSALVGLSPARALNVLVCQYDQALGNVFHAPFLLAKPESKSAGWVLIPERAQDSLDVCREHVCSVL